MKLTTADYRRSPDDCEGAWTFCLVPNCVPGLPPGATMYWRSPSVAPSVAPITADENPALTQGEVREFRVFYWRSDSLPVCLPAAVRIK